MNISNFVQTEGYPLTGERLQELQTSFQILNAFGSLAGNLTIISGCNTVGTTVQNGFVFINGELLEFREASVTPNSNVIIIEEKVNKAFKNSSIKQVYTIRYASFGTSVTSWLWTDFKRPIETKLIQAALDLKAEKWIVDNLITRLTNAETKLATIAVGAEVNVQSDWNVTDATSDAFIKNKLVVNKTFIGQGVYALTDPGQDTRYTVPISPQLTTSNYMVLGGFKSKGSNWNNDNDLVWAWGSPYTFQFELYIREVAGNVQNVEFHYVIIAL